VTTIRIMVTGERDWEDREMVFHALDAQLARAALINATLVVIHGDCPTGADAFAQEWCEQNEVEPERFPADWFHGGSRLRIDLSAGPRRNRKMIATKPDGWLAFWSGRVSGSGTHDCFMAATRAGIDGIVYAKNRRGA